MTELLLEIIRRLAILSFGTQGAASDEAAVLQFTFLHIMVNITFIFKKKSSEIAMLPEYSVFSIQIAKYEDLVLTSFLYKVLCDFHCLVQCVHHEFSSLCKTKQNFCI